LRGRRRTRPADNHVAPRSTGAPGQTAFPAAAPPYAAAYARLIPAAQAGDANAQYGLGLLLYECRDIPADAPTLEREIDAVHQTHSRDGWT